MPNLKTFVAVLVWGILSTHLSAQSIDDEAFFKAVSTNHEATVQLFLTQKINPNIKNRSGEPALIVALREDAMKAFDALMMHPEIDVNQRNNSKESALMIAAYKNNFVATQHLLDKKAEVNNTGWTALHYAAMTGNVDLVRVLLDHHAFVDAESPGKITPLMMAARAGHVEVVKLLLEEGAIVTLRNDAGLSAEDFALQHGHHELAKAFQKQRERNKIPAWKR